MNNFQIFWDQFVSGGYNNFLLGLKNTALIAVFGLVIGFLIGCILATVKIIPKENVIVTVCKRICDIYIMLFRGTPMVVQLLLMHFALFPLIGLNIDSVIEAVIIFGMNSAAYMAEILRSGINAVDSGQMEAGRSLGFGFTATMMRIVLPQAIKNILPTLGNEFIALIKETSVVSFVGATDLYVAFNNIGSNSYEFMVPYLVMAIIYIVLVMVISALVKLMERSLRKSDRSR